MTLSTTAGIAVAMVSERREKGFGQSSRQGRSMARTIRAATTSGVCLLPLPERRDSCRYGRLPSKKIPFHTTPGARW